MIQIISLENGSTSKEEEVDGETEKTPTTDDELPVTITNSPDSSPDKSPDDLNATTIPTEEDKVNANFTNGQAIGGMWYLVKRYWICWSYISIN